MDEQLRTRLEKLQDELDRAEPADAGAQEHVAEVRRDVQDLIERGGRAPGERRQSLLERLRNVIPFVESTHPNLTLAMSEVMDELTRMSL